MIYSPPRLQPDWSEVTSHGTSFIYTYKFLKEVYIHEIYTHAIEQCDWSECTSHGRY